MTYHLPIQPESRDSERARLSMRVNICKACPYRTSSATFEVDDQPRCEQTCEIFTHLPELMQAANRMDPMIGSIEKVLNQRIQSICDRTPAPAELPGKRRPLLRCRKLIVSTLAKVSGY